MTLFSLIPHDTLRQEHKVKNFFITGEFYYRRMRDVGKKKKKLQCQWKLHTEFGIKSKSKVKET